jgi:hypothetical protein
MITESRNGHRLLSFSFARPPQPERKAGRTGQAHQPKHQAREGDVVARPQREQ